MFEEKYVRMFSDMTPCRLFNRLRTTLHHVTEKRNLRIIVVHFTQSKLIVTVRLYYTRLKRLILSINVTTGSR
jgi:hypothetical protein